MDSFIQESFDKSISNRIDSLDIPELIPKMDYTYKGGKGRNKNVLIRYHNDDYIISQDDLVRFTREIIDTRGRYVYPLVFVRIVRPYITTCSSSDSITFQPQDLRTLQIWGNQLRNIADTDNRQIDLEYYLAYQIATKAIEYANNSFDN